MGGERRPACALPSGCGWLWAPRLTVTREGCMQRLGRSAACPIGNELTIVATRGECRPKNVEKNQGDRNPPPPPPEHHGLHGLHTGAQPRNPSQKKW